VREEMTSELGRLQATLNVSWPQLEADASSCRRIRAMIVVLWEKNDPHRQSASTMLPIGTIYTRQIDRDARLVVGITRDPDQTPELLDESSAHRQLVLRI
jgi:hypothetical protein